MKVTNLSTVYQLKQSLWLAIHIENNAGQRLEARDKFGKNIQINEKCFPWKYNRIYTKIVDFCIQEQTEIHKTKNRQTVTTFFDKIGE